MKRIISSVLAVLLLLGACAACSKPKYTEDEIRAALEALIPASAELNEIYFGEGLPIAGDEEEYAEFYDSLDSDMASLGYVPVAEDAKYRTEAELRDATLAVFTEEYASFLFDRAFSGFSVSYDDETTVNAVYAMYIETDGVLTKRIGAKDDAILLGREYSIDGLVIARQKDNFVIVDVPTTREGQTSVTVRLKLVNTDGGWRLDSPTY